MRLEEILSIVKSDYAVPKGADYRKLALDLQNHLGSSELDTRDNSCFILYNWCIKGVFSDSVLNDLGNKMIGNLSKDIEKLYSDSVFTRSFSALVLCGILKADGFFYNGEIENRF